MQTSAAGKLLLMVVLLAVMGGLLYAYLQSIPGQLAAPLIAAFALEAALYVASVTEAGRGALERLRPLPIWMAASALLPYVLYALPTGLFRWPAFAALAGLALLVSLWYRLLPRHPAADVLFLALIAAGLLSGVFPRIYARPAPRLQVAILGELMWTRLALLAVLLEARMEVKGFGLLPNRREWLAGLRNYALFLPAGVFLGWAVGFASFHPRPGPWWQTLPLAVATFLGMLWVVGLREEFFFRGLLQEWLAGWLRGTWAGLLAASLLFGAVHLWFRQFPNWRFALLAALAGFFYGRAYLEAASVRAAMVTHALLVTTWRVLFSS